MRITFVLPDANMGGGTRVIAIHAQNLVRRGHQVVLVSRPITLTIKDKVKSLMRGQGWPAPPSTGPSHLDGRGLDCRSIPGHRPLGDDDIPDADVVIATWWETAEWVQALSPAKGAKAYFLQHFEAFDYLPGRRVEATWTLPLHKIVISQWLARLARDRFGDDHLSVCANAVDLTQFHAPPRGKQATPTVGMLYSRVRWKGADIMLAAFQRAARAVPGLRLVAFGTEPPAPHLPLPADALYTRRPAQDQIRNIYAACDAWLFGSRDEGFGLPILEAMACRTPVIATPAGAAPELVGAGGGGWMVRPEDPEDMAAAIERMCRMPDGDWRALSDRVQALASSYTWDDATAAFEAALMLAIERSQRGELARKSA